MEKEKKLTVKETAFVKEITRTDADKPTSIAAAYRRAYEPKGNATTSRTEASKMYKRPHIQNAIARVNSKLELERERKRKSSASAIEAALWREAQGADHSRDRISALKALSSLVAPKGAGDPALASSAASKEEIIDRIKMILASTLGEPVNVTPGGSELQVVSSDEPPVIEILDPE